MCCEHKKNSFVYRIKICNNRSSVIILLCSTPILPDGSQILTETMLVKNKLQYVQCIFEKACFPKGFITLLYTKKRQRSLRYRIFHRNSKSCQAKNAILYQLVDTKKPKNFIPCHKSEVFPDIFSTWTEIVFGKTERKFSTQISV